MLLKFPWKLALEFVNPRNKLICRGELFRQGQIQISSALIEIGRTFSREQSQDSALMINPETLLSCFVTPYQNVDLEVIENCFGDILSEKSSSPSW